jgi:hypothetical protein
MFRYRPVALVAALAATWTVAACGPAPEAGASEDAHFAALQDRGADAQGMGVDQYASTHLFDALPDGGRIEFQFNSEDREAVAQIRSHLHEIQVAFQAGDFSTPAFVHATEVPGTPVMAARREHIEYLYRDLPRGGELRLVTQDAEALEAIRAFMAFQRDDHRAGGIDHAAMDHGAMDHSTMDHGAMDHGAVSQVAPQDDAEARAERHLAMGGGDQAFAADMELVHQLVTNNRAITRTVEHLPNGIRTLTESSSPAIAGFIKAHVASMEKRLEEGEVFNLFSPTLPAIFEGYDRIRSDFEYTTTGVAVVQTSDDPALVEALQAHAAEVTELVDEGMIAMMRGMMQGGAGGMMGGGMHGGGATRHAPTP